jgi:hypothetical protein
MALTTGLISYWKLDETSDGSGAVTRNDSHGTNHLTDNGTTPSAAGKINNGSSHTPANAEFLSVADNAGLSISTAFTFQAWIKINTLAVNLAIGGKWDYQTQGGFLFQTDQSQTDELICYIASTLNDNGANHGYTTDANLLAGTWYHTVVVYDGSLAAANRLKIYLNAASKSLTLAGTIPTTIPDNTADFKIGKFGGTLTRYFDGLIDEVGYWNRALSSAEITQLYNSGAGLAYPFSASSGGSFLLNFV